MPPIEKKHLLTTYLGIILHDHSFTFDDKLFRQNVGVSMGSKVSSEAAGIAMGKILKETMSKYEDTSKILRQRRRNPIFGNGHRNDTRVLQGGECTPPCTEFHVCYGNQNSHLP